MEEALVCGEEKTTGIPVEIIIKGGYKIPECYLKAEYMVPIGKTIRERENKKSVTLPLCQVVEVEFLGGEINYAADQLGPRVTKRRYSSIEELPMGTKTDFSKKLCQEVYKAARELKQDGEEVILNVSGPITVLSGLVEMQQIFVQRRKNPKVYREAIQWVTDNLIQYVKQMKETISIVSLADPAAGLELLGSKVAVEIAELSYIPLLSAIKELGISVHLCPRMTAVLLKSKLIHKEKRKAPVNCSYEEMVLDVSKKGAELIAHQCLKQTHNAGVEGIIQVLMID